MITVSVVSGRSPDYLKRCLRSLSENGQGLISEVAVIDNIASYDVAAIVKKSYPSARIISNDKLKGFAENHNQVLRKLNTPYALVINDDIEFGADCVKRLYDFMESHPDAGLAGPLLHAGSWDGKRQTAGGSVKPIVPVHIKTIVWNLMKLLRVDDLFDKWRGYQRGLDKSGAFNLGYISGACCLMRKKALDEVGTYDDKFYMYLEDADLGKRMIGKGWKCYQVPDAEVAHYEGKSFSFKTYKWIIQSAVYYAGKYYGIINQVTTWILAITLRIVASFMLPQDVSKSDFSRKVLNPKRILVLKLGGIGDVLLISPALRSLKQRFPDASISLIAERHSAEIIKGSPYIDDYILMPPLYDTPLRIARELFGLLGLAWYLAFNKYDVYIEFQNLYSKRGIIKPLLIGYLSGAHRRFGLDAHHRGFFLTDKIHDDEFQNRHNIQKYLDVVKTLGADDTYQTPEIAVSRSDTGFAAEFAKKHGITENDFLIGIHTGGNPSYPVRTSWLPERFAEVANVLADKYQAKILLTSGPSDLSIVSQIKERLNKLPVILSGASIKQLAAVIQHCKIFISNDAGPMHIAVAMKVPAIGIFGPGHWPSYGSYPPEAKFIALYKKIDCWPCNDLKCISRECMKLITVDDVLNAVNMLINKVK
ncbi:MAG: glycosyltransferase [Planctomycetes bacterium]|nr:glycosyltransferase [Planctomycetota bacterium]